MYKWHDYERHGSPLAPLSVFLRRIGKNSIFAGLFLVFSLTIGTFGYHWFGDLDWVDSFLNGAMILTGMGPVNPMTTVTGKLFAAFYALYSGITFLTLIAIMAAPIYHRMLHYFHLGTEGDEPKAGDQK